MPIKKNPKLFRELSDPFENGELAVEACQAFFDALSKIREEHRIVNVYCILSCSHLTGEEEEEQEIVVPMMFGDSLKAPMLTAYAAGYEASAMEQAIANIRAQGRKRALKE